MYVFIYIESIILKLITLLFTIEYNFVVLFNI